MRDRGVAGLPITAGAIIVIVLIILLAAARGDVTHQPEVFPTTTIPRAIPTSTTAAPSPTEVPTEPTPAPEVTTTLVSPSTTTTSTTLVDGQGVFVVSGDAKKMTTFAQPAPCIVHRAPNGQPLPDPSCTPSAISTRVTQDNLQETICLPKYTDGVRPPTSQTNKAKKIVALAYDQVGQEGEYDHVIPLELGGANDVRNLWLEPGKIPNPKDAVENKLKALVCAGKVLLVEAQHRIAKDWTTALDGLPAK